MYKNLYYFGLQIALLETCFKKVIYVKIFDFYIN